MKLPSVLTLFVVLSLLSFFSREAHADDASKRQAAEALLVAIGTEQHIREIQSKFFEPRLKLDKSLAHYEIVLPAFYARFMSFASLREQLVGTVMKEFTEEELDAAVQFLSTPAGQKLYKQLPELRTRIGQRILNAGQAHVQELRSMLAEELKGTEPDLELESE